MKPPIPPSRLSWLTLVASFLALAGLGMALPYAVQTWNFEGEYDRKLDLEHYLPPAGWQKTLWIAAFAVGSFSLVLALFGWIGEMRRNSRSGRRVAMLTLIIVLLGTSVWLFPACVEASTGL
jgi:cytochrome bd-type quinol oxidase subunit 2